MEYGNMNNGETQSYSREDIERHKALSAKKSSARKRAAKRKKKRNRIIYIAFVLCASLILAVWAINVANDMLGLMKDEGTVEIYIPKGSNTSQIADMLDDAGVIKHKTIFKLFSRVTGYSSKMQYGKYEIDKSMDYLQICVKLKQTVPRDEITVTIPEGYELREIFAKLEAEGVCSADSLYKSMEKDEFDYDFLKDIPKRDNWLEGYLFPDTYNFYRDDDPDSVIRKFLNNFDNRYNDELRKRTQDLGYTMDEVVILASVVEREAGGEEDRTTVSSVFVNRLNNPSYQYLQSCASVQYVLKERKSVLSTADTKIDSPYNTYMYPGLPVGPIASPGLASIKAVLYPADTNYYYFVVDGSGVHHFSTTLDEHNRAVKSASATWGTGTVGN